MYYHVDYRRYKAVLKRLLSILLIFTVYLNSFSVAHAADWKSGATKEIRQKIAQNNIYGNDSGRIVVREYDRTRQMVNASISDSIVNEGSKASASAKVKVPVNPAKAASTVMKRLAKGGIAGMLGGAAVQALIDGVGWVMDPNNNSISKLELDQSNTQYLYTPSAWGNGTYFPTALAACQYSLSVIQKVRPDSGYASVTTNGNNCSYYTPVYKATDTLPLQKIANPSYDPKKPSQVLTAVSNDDLANQIKKQIDNKTDTGAQIVQDAYSAVDANGKATQDLTKAVDDLNDTVKDLTDAFKDILKSDDPIATGKTDEMPVVTTGTEGSSDSQSESKDKDGNPTGSTSGNSSFQLPPWCTWAADNCQWHKEDKKHQEDEKTFWDKVKEFFDWTKDDSKLPDQDNEPPEIKEIEPPTLNTSTFKGTAGCPAPIQVNVTIGSKGTTEISYEPICQFAEKWSFVSPLIGFLSGAMILIGVGRKGEDSEI